MIQGCRRLILGDLKTDAQLNLFNKDVKMIRIVRALLTIGLYVPALVSNAFENGLPFKSKQDVNCDEKSQSILYEQIMQRDQGKRTLLIESLADVTAVKDQSKVAELEKEMSADDNTNQELLDDLVLKCGWPTGPFAKINLEAAFLTVQHAPRKFRMKYQTYIEQSYTRGELPGNLYRLFIVRMSK